MLAQLIANGLIAGSLIALLGLGFSLVFRVVRFFHFTYALSIALGAYSVYGFHSALGLSLHLAVVGAVVISALFGAALARFFFMLLRQRQVSPLLSLLASLGAYTVGQNLLSLGFGDAALSVRSSLVSAGWLLLGARVTPAQLATVVLSLLASLAVGTWWRVSRVGIEAQAISQDEALAAIAGVRVSRVTAWLVVLGSVIGGSAGVLSAFDRDLQPTMGLPLFLLGVVAMIVGGQRTLIGVWLAGLLLGLCQNIAVLWIPAAWQEAVAYAVLIVSLLLRPHRLCGVPSRAATT